MLPSGLFNAGRDRNRADASNVGMLRAYPPEQRPFFCYIGTEEGSFLGAKIDDVFRLFFCFPFDGGPLARCVE